MPLRFWLHLAEIAFVILLAAALFVSWRESRLEHDQLTTALAEAKQALSAADARQHDRDARLNQTLAVLADRKSQFQTPAQLTTDIANQIPLPAPFEVQSAASPSSNAKFPDSSASGKAANPLAGPRSSSESPMPAKVQTVIPDQDLKPLYDFALDCKACQAKLDAAQGDLADEQAKTAVIGKERDAALKAAKGGSMWRRTIRAAKWFALGAAAGALAGKSAH
jgi:hypothetical protein